MEKINISAPLTDEQVNNLKCGDMVLISGIIYTARDAAHMKMIAAIEQGLELPFDLRGNVIYYAGPTPARPGNVSGAFGPTTSGRMDKMTAPLLDRGLKGMIGKGVRSAEVVSSIIKNNAVYFAAIGGAGALLSDSVKKAEVIAYEELGSEAVRRVEVINFPAVVAVDNKGNCIYERKMNK